MLRVQTFLFNVKIFLGHFFLKGRKILNFALTILLIVFLFPFLFSSFVLIHVV